MRTNKSLLRLISMSIVCTTLFSACQSNQVTANQSASENQTEAKTIITTQQTTVNEEISTEESVADNTVKPFVYDKKMSDDEIAENLQTALKQLPENWTQDDLYEIVGNPDIVMPKGIHQQYYNFNNICLEYTPEIGTLLYYYPSEETPSGKDIFVIDKRLQPKEIADILLEKVEELPENWTEQDFYDVFGKPIMQFGSGINYEYYLYGHCDFYLMSFCMIRIVYTDETQECGFDGYTIEQDGSISVISEAIAAQGEESKESTIE